MRPQRSFVRTFAVLLLFVPLVFLSLPLAASAQSPTPTPSPVVGGAEEEPKGLCTPWHRCLAITTGGVVLLWLLSAAAMYGIQRRGFDTIEHRQGAPQGVRVSKE